MPIALQKDMAASLSWPSRRKAKCLSRKIGSLATSNWKLFRKASMTMWRSLRSGATPVLARAHFK
eukprot:3612758-Alexandrium_andersonii.AAC.1